MNVIILTLYVTILMNLNRHFKHWIYGSTG